MVRYTKFNISAKPKMEEPLHYDWVSQFSFSINTLALPSDVCLKLYNEIASALLKYEGNLDSFSMPIDVVEEETQAEYVAKQEKEQAGMVAVEESVEEVS